MFEVRCCFSFYLLTMQSLWANFFPIVSFRRTALGVQCSNVADLLGTPKAKQYSAFVTFEEFCHLAQMKVRDYKRCAKLHGCWSFKEIRHSSLCPGLFPECQRKPDLDIMIVIHAWLIMLLCAGCVCPRFRYFDSQRQEPLVRPQPKGLSNVALASKFSPWVQSCSGFVWFLRRNLFNSTFCSLEKIRVSLRWLRSPKI